ncbi:MAG: phosphate acetyltransferase [Neisseria sp.]|nr:phosphate acetyltransferase [Neisseria sp.]
MANFLIVPTDEHAGTTSLALGIARAFEQAGHRIAFFKPITQNIEQTDNIDISTHFSRQLFHLGTPDSLSLNQAENWIAQGKSDDLIESIVARFNDIKEDHAVAIIEGLVPDPSRAYLADKNKAIAGALNAEVLLIVDAESGCAETVAEVLKLNLQQFSDGQAPVAGYVLNRLPRDIDCTAFAADVGKLLKSDLPCVAVIPFAPEKSARRMCDVARHLNAEVLSGADKLSENRVSEIVIAGQSASHMAERFKPGALIIVPGDREDVMMASALVTARGVPLAGLVLSCNSQPSDNLQKLIAPVLKDNLPVLLSQYDTYETARRLFKQSPHVPHDDNLRMETIVDYVAEHLNIAPLAATLAKPKSTRLSPAAFRFRMMEQARSANKRIVLPEGAEPRTVQAAVICHQKGIARCVLLAAEAEVKEVAARLDLTLPADLEIIDPKTILPNYVAPLVEMRKSKGLSEKDAAEYLEDTVVIGTMMMALDEVDGLVSGAVHTTANTIRPALQLIKTAPGSSLVSSVFFMLMPEQVLVYGDCAVNPNPSAAELADIAIQSADSAAAFGIEPRVAMISYSTGSSGSGAEVEKVTEATRLAREKRPDLAIDGPLQYDAASVPSVGKQKAPDSPVAGRATVFVFPDLNTGNTTYKAVQRSANVLSVGPMLQGLNKPVNDLSRGALVDDIVYTIAITAIQAEQFAQRKKG